MEKKCQDFSQWKSNFFPRKKTLDTVVGSDKVVFPLNFRNSQHESNDIYPPTLYWRWRDSWLKIQKRSYTLEIMNSLQSCCCFFFFFAPTHRKDRRIRFVTEISKKRRWHQYYKVAARSSLHWFNLIEFIGTNLISTSSKYLPMISEW